MWFDDSMSNARQEIKKCIAELGYEPSIVDEIAHNEKITDRLIAEIKLSKFVICDFSHDNSGVRGSVYFEAGFAQGLGKPVIWLANKNSKLAFDTAQYNNIMWENPSEISDKLKDRIVATIK